MKLYTAHRAPNPRRVLMFLAEKQITGIECVDLDLGQGEHRSPAFLQHSPLGKVPALVLDDGRALTESRAICTYLEGLYPQTNLMGHDATERAFIEMADRRAEWDWFALIGQCVRHTHPGLAVLEQPQFPEFGRAQGEKVVERARWLDALLRTQPFVAGERFTIADITAFCALDFARGLMKLRPEALGLGALHAWHQNTSQRPSAQLR